MFWDKDKNYTKRDASEFNCWRTFFQILVCKFFYMIRYKLVYRLEVNGLENVPKDNEYIVCPNHLSTLDPPLICGVMPRRVSFMAKKELFDIPKENIVIEPLIHGGKSTTIYRAGTPALPLVVSLMRALELVLGDIDYHNKHIEKLNLKIKQGLSKYDKVYFNTTDKSIKDIINISIIGIKPETFIHALEEYEIYVSTKSACTKTNTLSNSVLALTKDRKRAESTVRISISYKTTEEEIDFFLEKFDECYNHLLLR